MLRNCLLRELRCASCSILAFPLNSSTQFVTLRYWTKNIIFKVDFHAFPFHSCASLTAIKIFVFGDADYNIFNKKPMNPVGLENQANFYGINQIIIIIMCEFVEEKILHQQHSCCFHSFSEHQLRVIQKKKSDF